MLYGGINIAQDSNSINVSYETLFELLRIEKGKDELQKQDPDFFLKVASFIQEQKENAKDDIALLKQLSNIKSILKQLYEIRERKIVSMALNKSRTKSSIVDASLLLKEEKIFFEKLVETFDSFREGILSNLYSGQNPEVKIKNDISKRSDASAEKTTKMIRFLVAVPKFLGHDMQEYGPFEEEDVASLPIKLADILVKKKRAEEIIED